MREPKRLLLVELGGPSKAFLIRRLLSLGAELHLATQNPEPWIADYLGAGRIIRTDPYNSIQLLADVVAHCERERIAFDAAGTFWEHTVTQTATLAAAMGLPGIPPGAAHRSSANKLLMRDWCRRAGIRMPSLEVLRGLEELARQAHHFPLPAVVKPVFGDDSFGVMKIESPADSAAVIEECHRTWSRDHRAFKNFPDLWLLEQYLPGSMVSVDGVVQGGQVHFAGVVEIGMGPEPRFTQNANWLPSRISPQAAEACFSLTRRILVALGFDHCGFHCELRLSPDGQPGLVEIAARLPGGLIPQAYHRAYGLDLAEAMLDIWTGAPVELRKDRRTFVLQKGVFPGRAGILRRCHGLERARQREGVWSIVPVASPGKRVVTYPDVPQPLYVYAVEGATPEVREELSRWVEEQIEVEIT